MIVKIEQNHKTTFTRMCIGEAIIKMMKEQSFYKLKISEIVKVAGVARMTFYKYYDSPYAALTDYLHIIVADYMTSIADPQKRSGYMTYERILHTLLFFDQYADFFLTLDRQGLYNIMQDGVNEFMEKNLMTARKLSRYELYCYSGGLLNAFMQWEKTGKQEKAEDVATFIYLLYHGVGRRENAEP